MGGLFLNIYLKPQVHLRCRYSATDTPIFRWRLDENDKYMLRSNSQGAKITYDRLIEISLRVH